jgi:ribose transport system ATP-binding protein
MTHAIELSRISKSYGPQRVVSDVSLSITAGTIVSIIGENGAGKSTLAKIISGNVQPDCGEIRLFGEKLSFQHPAEAIAAGVGIVHQEISLLDNLSIAENISLGREPLIRGFLDRRKMHQIAQEALAMLSVSIDTNLRVGALSLAQKQLVEIAKALSCKAKVLIFDEPTSSLSDHDGEQLLKTICMLKTMGVTILYVSHRLSEVMQISDRVVALRDGVLSGDIPAPISDRQQLIASMIGREMRDMYEYAPRKLGTNVLRLKNYCASEAHKSFDLTIRAGEIVGIAGLVGSGRTELLEALYGIRPAASGEVYIKDTFVTITSPHAALAAGVSLVPESRKDQGLIGTFSISDTIALTANFVAGWSGMRSYSDELRAADQWRDTLEINCLNNSQPATNLSGGNQQKVILAKCLASQPSLLLLDEPTRGIDVNARKSIYKLLLSLAEQGLAILFVSSELEEVMGISDRILVMNEGVVTGELLRPNFSEQAIMALAAHHKEHQVCKDCVG